MNSSRAFRNWGYLDNARAAVDPMLFAPIRPGEENGLEFLPIQGAEGVIALRRPQTPDEVVIVAVLELATLMSILPPL
ncbi:hypothetical protein ABZ815_20150 [Nonomuraea sp. NPDC047529]|uniref:hypothetical protein n=1 Tax=Nonomuraea sp. NPDC047529 TaxID=3155623 RepID=UPI0033CF4F11